MFAIAKQNDADGANAESETTFQSRNYLRNVALLLYLYSTKLIRVYTCAINRRNRTGQIARD
eukprot:COSAG02_NODE_96_length_37408_cov_9.762604_17_plen_62_part_00